MKPEKILDAMNDLDGQFIREARAEHTRKSRLTGRRFTVLIAAVVALMAVSITAFASETVVGWFRQYFQKQTDVPLTSGQVKYLENNEQVIGETQAHNGYTLELKSALNDGTTVYAIVGLTAPVDVTLEDVLSLWGSDIDVYDQNNKPCASYGLEICDNGDGQENTADLVFEITPADWNESILWTLRIGSLAKDVWNKEYEQELLDTKYAGQENIMLTDEEAAKVHQQVTIAEGPWEFTIDLAAAECEQLEMITTPVKTQSCYGYKPDGTEVYEEVEITSFVLSPLSAFAQAKETVGALELSNNGDRLVYVVLKDGTQIQLITNWGRVGDAHFRAESPIILEEVDHILLADGTKISVPE